jgi:hypothetical protein
MYSFDRKTIWQKCVKPDDERNMDSGGLELHDVVGLMK